MEEKAIVSTTQSKMRLDLFLAFSFPQYSRTNLRKLIDAGAVQVNGQVVYRPNYRVEEGSEVLVKEGTEARRKPLKPFPLKLNILYQDKHIVLVDKPSGLKVHPAAIGETETLLNALYHNLSDVIGEFGVSLVNRIDKNTSGIIVAAISPKGVWHYSKQFAEAKANKEYLVAVSAKWRQRYGKEKVRCGNFLHYDANQRKQLVDKEKGNYALTYFQLHSIPNQDFCVIKAIPKTGRTHQIRAQLAHLGYPVVGDKKYDGMLFSRLMLHSFRLQLEKLDGGTIKVIAPIPKEFTIRSSNN